MKKKNTYPNCTGPIEWPVRTSSVIKARVIDSVVLLRPPSCYKVVVVYFVNQLGF